jgi:hypothetical protein
MEKVIINFEDYSLEQLDKLSTCADDLGMWEVSKQIESYLHVKEYI